MARASLVVMARWPAPGRCKGRLARDLGIARAAAIQSRMTIHTLAVARGLADKGLVDLQLAVSGLAPHAARRWGSNLGVEAMAVVMQGSGSMGSRLRRQLLSVQGRLKQPSSPERCSMVIGTDLPGLCQRDLLEALESLQSHGLVLGPASDGGYWLLGLSGDLINPIPSWPFAGIPWGTDQVMATTLEQARRAGVSPALLRQQNDVDQSQDLRAWQG
ncbi:MAG: TIGR04282 family arsenosugar biosynthesis glycosyltransferase [Prochlorococcus sp.]